MVPAFLVSWGLVVRLVLGSGYAATVGLKSRHVRSGGWLSISNRSFGVHSRNMQRRPIVSGSGMLNMRTPWTVRPFIHVLTVARLKPRAAASCDWFTFRMASHSASLSLKAPHPFDSDDYDGYCIAYIVYPELTMRSPACQDIRTNN